MGGDTSFFLSCLARPGLALRAMDLEQVELSLLGRDDEYLF